MSAQELYTPTCYQTTPIGKVTFPVRPSPTFSHESRNLWASGNVRVLDAIHGHIAPTHFVTIKFQRPESIEALKGFTRKLADAAYYFNKSQTDHIAGRWVVEIEADNSCHLHILIRATHNPGASAFHSQPFDPTDWLKTKTAKINGKLGTIAIVQYCEPIATAEGASKYLYKLGRKDVLLFARGLPLRQTGKFGKYFLGRSQSELRSAQYADHILSLLEIEAERICGFAGDQNQNNVQGACKS